MSDKKRVLLPALLVFLFFSGRLSAAETVPDFWIDPPALVSSYSLNHVRVAVPVKGFLTVAPKFGDWKIAYRAMVQATFRDERRGDYRFNPKTYMRNRLQVTWSVPHQPVKLYLSEEFWWRLYKPGDNIIDNLRSTVGVEYSINKHHTLDFYLRSDNEIQVKNPDNVLSIGVGYKFD